MSVGSVPNPLTPGMILNPGQTPTINWTWAGGDATTIVRVTLVSNWNQIASYKAVWYAYAAAGQVHMLACTGGSPPVFCTYGVPPSKSGTGAVIIDVLPGGGVADTINGVPGISGPVRFSWAYHYVFGGLTISN